eukprot:COSAG01_NODE_3064_length_6647_cov_29.485186_5_plen_437_part_00
MGHWAPIELVVNLDGPDKSVIIPFLFRLRPLTAATSAATSVGRTRSAVPTICRPSVVGTLPRQAMVWRTTEAVYGYRPAHADDGLELLQQAMREADEETQRGRRAAARLRTEAAEAEAEAEHRLWAERAQRGSDPQEMYASRHHSRWRDNADWGSVPKGWLQDLRLPAPRPTRALRHQALAAQHRARSPHDRARGTTHRHYRREHEPHHRPPVPSPQQPPPAPPPLEFDRSYGYEELGGWGSIDEPVFSMLPQPPPLPPSTTPTRRPVPPPSSPRSKLSGGRPAAAAGPATAAVARVMGSGRGGKGSGGAMTGPYHLAAITPIPQSVNTAVARPESHRVGTSGAADVSVKSPPAFATAEELKRGVKPMTLRACTRPGQAYQLILGEALCALAGVISALPCACCAGFSAQGAPRSHRGAIRARTTPSTVHGRQRMPF